MKGKLHALPPLDGLPPFNIDLQVITNFLEEIKTTKFADHPFIKYK
jgi:hypothetical protein